VGHSVLTQEKIIFILKTRYAINSVVNFYDAGVVIRDRRIGSWIMRQTRLLDKQVNPTHGSVLQVDFVAEDDEREVVGVARRRLNQKFVSPEKTNK
jgi:hypothetical protein